MPPSDNNFSLGHLLKMEKESGWREGDRKWRARTFSMNSITEVTHYSRRRCYREVTAANRPNCLTNLRCNLVAAW